MRDCEQADANFRILFKLVEDFRSDIVLIFCITLATGRMLLCVRDRITGETPVHASLQRQFSHGHSGNEGTSVGGGTRVSHFLPTSRRIVQFSNGKGPRPDARIVYMDGAFDLFHVGHVEVLLISQKPCAPLRLVVISFRWIPYLSGRLIDEEIVFAFPEPQFMFLLHSSASGIFGF